MAKFKLNDIRRIAKDVSRRASYPIESADELAEALGGKGENVEFGGRAHKVAEVEEIPAEEFPIESEEDFVAKMASLRGASGDEAEEMPRGKEVKERPAEAGQPPRR